MNVKFKHEIDVHAPVELVWSVLSDTNKWPLWFPDVEQLTNLTGLQSGGTFQWHVGDEVGTGEIVSLQEGERLQVVTQLGGKQVTHSFAVTHGGGLFGIGGHATQLEDVMEYDPPGGIIGDFIASGNPKDALKVKHTVEKIKQLAEGQSS